MATDYVPNPDRVKNFFNELDIRKSLLTTITQLNKTLTHHFASLDDSLSSRSQALDSQIQALDAHTKKTLDSLDTRESAIPERESAAAARIEEQKDAAVADIEAEAAAAENGGGGERSLSGVLRTCCRRMDSKGLIRFLLAKRKESVVLRADIAAAVAEECVDVMSFVLDAVEEFVEMKVEGKVGMADRRWAVGILIQAVLPVADGGGVASSVRERAAGVVEKWRGAMSSGGGESGVGAGEAAMFLQAVAGFGLKGRFEEDYLMKLVLEHATRRDMAKVALALGFGDKIKDIIDELVKNGKEIEAVYFVYEAGLTEQFPPLPLLKTYLSNSRKIANNISKKGKYSMSAVEEANNSELNATKAIIKCVEDHKLESQFTLGSLRSRVTQLEKAKSEKKKSGPSGGKPSNKRAHSSGGSRSGPGSGPPSSHRPPKAGRFSNPSPSFRHRNSSQSNQAAAAGRYAAPYSYPSHGMYEGPATASYGPGYAGARIQSPAAAALPQQYPYASPDIGPSGARVGGLYGGQGSYGGQASYGGAYDYSAAAGPAYPNYQQ